jgi:hypothetical protein
MTAMPFMVSGRYLQHRHEMETPAAGLGNSAGLALRLQGDTTSMWVEPFAVAIRCTSTSDKVDGKTRSKWSRALRVAETFKARDTWVKAFIKGPGGGINKCADKGPRDRRGPTVAGGATLMRRASLYCRTSKKPAAAIEAQGTIAAAFVGPWVRRSTRSLAFILPLPGALRRIA